MTGNELYDLGLTRVGCKYKLGVVAPKDDSDYMGAFDCAEFASWLVKQAYGIDYGMTKDDAYTGFWDRDAKSKGVIIPIKQAIATKGAFLLRVSDGGSIGHIVVSDGKGGTVEAHSTAKGVGTFKTDNRRFDYGILIPGVCYQTFDFNSSKPSGIVYRFTSPLMRSDVIKTIQKAVGVKQDGYYGKDTMNAVVNFQKKNGLTPDGEVYTETAKALKIKL